TAPGFVPLPAGRAGLAGVVLWDPIVDGDTLRGCFVAQVSAHRPVGPVGDLLALGARQSLLFFRLVRAVADIPDGPHADLLLQAPVDRSATDLVLQVPSPALLPCQQLPPGSGKASRAPAAPLAARFLLADRRQFLVRLLRDRPQLAAGE